VQGLDREHATHGDPYAIDPPGEMFPPGQQRTPTFMYGRVFSDHRRLGLRREPADSFAIRTVLNPTLTVDAKVEVVERSRPLGSSERSGVVTDRHRP
jgi:hypothetical protein